MKLSSYFDVSSIIQDGDFETLAAADSCLPQSLIYADSLKYVLKANENANVKCIITKPNLAAYVSSRLGIVIDNEPRDKFYLIHEIFIDRQLYKLPFLPGIGTGCNIHPSAIIDPGCRIEDNVSIGEYAVIRGCVWIGANVKIDAGAKLGIDGILYFKGNSGPKLIKHSGYVRIRDGAILMANSVMVRSIHASNPTEVGQNSLIGINTIVGHDSKIGDKVVISNQCVVARGAVLEKEVFVATNVVIKESNCWSSGSCYGGIYCYQRCAYRNGSIR